MFNSQGEYNDALDAAMELATHVLGADVRLIELSEAMDRSDAVGPVLHPTEWIKGNKTLGDQRRVVDALIACRAALEPLRPLLITAMYKRAAASAGITYVLGMDGESRTITCLDCGMTSHNENDVRERYCGNCKEFHSMKTERARIAAEGGRT